MTLEEAHAEMVKRKWGFARNKATGTYAVGPIDDLGFVQVYAFDTDFTKAIQKAIEKDKTGGIQC